MSTIFALLLVVSGVGLIWGLICPKKFAQAINKPVARKDLSFVFGGLFVLFFVLTGVTAPKQVSKSDEPVLGASKVVPLNSPTAEPEKPNPVVSEIKVTEPIVFSSKTVDDPGLNKGVNKVTTTGVNGVKTLIYQVATLEGKETGRKLIKEEVTTQPITEVTSVGTKVAVQAVKPLASNCDPNYSGACVPIASDVDCAGGRGNGPAYVSGPVTVIGRDIYGLDGNGDGVGCE